MDFVKDEISKEFDSLGFKNQRRHLKTLPQTKVKRLDIDRDTARKALLAGKRISKTGKTYWETRKNRSDAKGKKV